MQVLQVNSDYPSLPCNSEAERQVLGMLLLDNARLSAVADYLVPDHFFEPVHQRIYAAIKETFAAGTLANPITLRERFNRDGALADIGGSGYLINLVAAAGTLANISSYAKQIYRYWQRREMIGWCDDANEKNRDFEADLSPDEIGASLVSRINDMAQTDNRRRLVVGNSLACEIIEDMKAPTVADSTGLSRLDHAMMGGLYAGYTYGFGGRKKTGKTVLAGTLSYNLDFAGIKHLFICGEMGAKQIHKRLMARFADSSDYAFRLKNMQTPDFHQRIGEYAATKGRNILFQNAPGMTFDDLKQYMSRAVYRDKVRGVILDYWQLVGGVKTGMSEAKHLDLVAQWIADFSREHEIWSVVFSQMNQEGNTRGGEGLRNACDQFYEIHRPVVTSTGVWFEMKETRYTEWGNIGEKEAPAFDLDKVGPHFSERRRMETNATYSQFEQ